MSQFLSDFIDFFGLGAFFDGSVLTVQDVLGLTSVAFIGALFMLCGIRCVFELVKTVTDWRNIG